MPDIQEMVADRVLLVSYGGGHAAMLAPVAAELRKRSVPISILALTTAPPVFHRFDLETIGMSDLVDHVQGYERACEVGAAIVGNEDYSPLVSRSETEAYFGIGFTDLVRTYGTPTAEMRFRENSRQGFLPTHFFKQLFIQSRPRCVVSTNSPRSERAALETARCEKIPSLCLVDLYAKWEVEWCAQPDYADLICVLNSHVAASFAEQKVPTEKIAVTGNPAFDRLGNLNVTVLRQEFRKRHGIGEHERVIAFISQPEPRVHPFSGEAGDPSLPSRIEAVLAEAFQGYRGYRVILRLHPSETRAHMIKGERIVVSAPLEPLDEVLCAADCIVTSSSTVGVEAGLLGIPVVQTMLSVFSADLPLGEMGYAREVYSFGEIEVAVREACALGSHAPKRKIVPAAPKVAELVEKLST